MSRWTRHPVLGLALLAAVTAGCAVQVTGTPQAASTPSSSSSNKPLADAERIHADDALGDLTRWNPCSVVIPEELPEEWTAELLYPVAFEYCVASVAMADDTSGEVQVGYLYRSTHDLAEFRSEERPGGITVVPVGTEDGSCTRDIVFADGIAVVVRTLPDDENDLQKVCEISDGVVDQVLDAVMAGQAAGLDLPENSLGEIDPCDVVEPAMLTAVPGMTPDVEAERQVSRHTCWWEAADGAMLNVEFEISDQPAGEDSTTTHGRETSTLEYEDDEASSLCRVDGEHVPFDDDLVERVAIYVYLKPGQVAQACAAGTAVAEALWPELPAL
jgi:hypothetical protein